MVVKRDAGTLRFQHRVVSEERETTWGPTARRDATVGRLFVRTVAMLDDDYVEKLKDTPAERWVEVTGTAQTADCREWRGQSLPKDTVPSVRLTIAT